MTLRPDDSVEHFVIVSELGAGGMGQVYLARDTRLERQVALKIMRSDIGESGNDARLLREARVAAGLEHPNVVTIYEIGEVHGAGEARGRPFIAMEFVKGKSLRAHIAEGKASIHRRLGWLIDIARALAAAHKQDIIHRDIKPENVMIRDDGVVKVLDFGLAKRAVRPSSTASEAQALKSLTAKGVAVGTPAYMAPEQMLQETLDGRADQFAWGILAYELLSGSLPWGEDADALLLISRVLVHAPEPLERVCPDVPPHVAAIVMRAMSKTREERFASMDELLVAMDAPTAKTGSIEAPLPPSAPGKEVPQPTVGEDTKAIVPSGSSRPFRRGLVYAAAASAVVGGALGVVFIARPPVSTRTATAQTTASLPECTRHTECVKKNGGKPSACNPKGRCAAIDTDDCSARFEPGDLDRDDTVWVGALFATKTQRTTPPTAMNAVELGRRDFARARQANLPPAAAGKVPPIAVAACDDSGDARRIANHLLERVGVPAVIGFGDPTEASELGARFAAEGVVSISAASLSLPPALTPGTSRMLWGATYDNATAARAIGRFIARKDADMRRRVVLGQGEKLRVATVRPRGATFTPFAEALLESLRPAGKPGLVSQEDYREIAFDGDAELREHALMATELATFRPHVVVFVAKGGLIPKVEKALAQEVFRPVYVTNTAFEPELLSLLEQGPNWRHRLYGISAVGAAAATARFVLHYNEAFAEHVAPSLAPTAAYDAFYALGYAIWANGGDKPTGANIAAAIPRLLPPAKTAVDVTPSAIPEGMGALLRGDPIDLNGTNGDLDFSPETGIAPTDITVVCPDDSSRASVRETGLVYRAASGQIEGELKRCR